MKISNLCFRSFQVAVLLFIVCLAVGCSVHPIIERDQIVSGSPVSTAPAVDEVPQPSESTDNPQNEINNSDIDQVDPTESEPIDSIDGQDEEELNVKNIAITFDDGPDLKFTPQILDILQEKDVKATFFVVGMQVNKYPEVLERIESEGHMIGNHSYYHPSFTKLDSDELAAEINNTDDKIFEVTGHKPTIVRPPYGAVNDEVREQLQEWNKEVVLWNIDPRDWDGTPVDDMFENIMDHARDGGNILLHSFGSKHVENTVKLLPLIIDELRAEGYSFVTVDKL